MSKPLSQGQTLLALAAASFRSDPGSWAQGWGYRKDGTYVDFDPDAGTMAMMVRCCADVQLMRLAPQNGGAAALREARQLLYQQLGCTFGSRSSIWAYNDAKGRTLADVIAVMDAAANLQVLTTERLADRIARGLATALAIAADPSPAHAQKVLATA